MAEAFAKLSLKNREDLKSLPRNDLVKNDSALWVIRIKTHFTIFIQLETIQYNIHHIYFTLASGK